MTTELSSFSDKDCELCTSSAFLNVGLEMKSIGDSLIPGRPLEGRHHKTRSSAAVQSDLCIGANIIFGSSSQKREHDLMIL